MSEALSAEAQQIVEKAEKLLRLAAKNPNEAKWDAALKREVEDKRLLDEAIEMFGG